MKEKVKRPPTKKKPQKITNEDGDKKVIVFIAVAVLTIVGVIIGFLVGCQKEDPGKEPGEDIKIPESNGGEKTEDEVDEDLTDSDIETTVKKTSVKKNNKKKYMIVFYYETDEEGEHSHRVSVEEGGKVSRFVPKGFDNCTYSTNNDFTDSFNFNIRITSNKEVYMRCSVTEYEINYNVETSNVPTYSITDGDVALTDYVPAEGIFGGWYADASFTKKVTQLSRDIVKYADSDNKINLYARVYSDEPEISIYDGSGELFNETSEIENNITSEQVCTEGATLLGWATSSGSSEIVYETNLTTINFLGEVNLYAVCGSAKVIYNSGDETKVVGYTEEDLANYDLPDAEDLGLETPTYFVPVEEPTETSKKVVEDERQYVAEDEIKLGDVTPKAADGYVPETGDNVEEIEKQFDGWKTEDGPGEEIEVPEDFTPPADETTEMEAEWVEPIPYEEPPENLEDAI